LLYLALFRLGSDSATLVDQSANGAAILHAYVQHTFGGAGSFLKLPAGGAEGSFLLAALIFIACLVTAVGLTCACAEFFAQYIPLSYRTLVFILGGFSMVVSNLGLSHLIQISIPVLTAIYPPCIALVVLSFTRSWWHNSTRIIAPAMFISLLFGILDGIKASAFGDMLPAWSQRLPLAEQGLAWLMPTVVMVILAIIWDRAAGRQVTSSAH
ncbi:L-asparagine permease, partial [Salmonella enterica subsp. enterica serovar Alachua str. R6-377]